LEKVLEQDPDNQLAKDYHASVYEKMVSLRRERETIKIDDNTKVIVSKKKKTEEYSGLILGEDDFKSSNDHRKKERKPRY
jgi:NAD(P)H-nitrite reductase large subunit